MWCSIKLQGTRLLALLVGAWLLCCVSGCLSDPAAGDLPWAKPEAWEGSPALPPGVLQQR
jgi:hypothetical protein